MKARPLLLVVIAAAVVAGGCTGDPDSDVSKTPTTEPAPEVRETPTRTSTPLPPDDVDLQPGTYTLDRTTVPAENSAGFDSVRITFAVPSGWESWDLGVLHDVGELGVTFWNVSSVPADPCHWERGGPRVGPTVGDLATALADQARRHATTPTDVTLGGYTGRHLTLRVPRHSEFSTCDLGYFVSWDAPPSSAFGRYQQGPGQVDELWILDVDGFRLVIDAGYWGSTPARIRAEIHRIVDSVRVERVVPLPEVIRYTGGDVIVDPVTGELGRRLTRGDLIAVDPATGESRILVDRAAIHGTVGSAAWSSDRRWLAYSDDKGLWVMSAKGTGQPHRVTTEPTLFAWSPTKARLAALRPSNDRYAIFLINPSTGRETNLGDMRGEDGPGFDGAVMAWSPDGTRIAYGTNGGPIYSVDVKSGDHSLLVRLPADATLIEGVDWSPDGQHLAIDGDGGDFEVLYLADGDGSHLRLVDGFVAGGVNIAPHPDPSDVTAWSPDGSRLAYVDYREDQARCQEDGEITCPGPEPPELRIWTISADGSARSLVGSHGCASGISLETCWQGFGAPFGAGRGITWSPDGSKIASSVTVDACETRERCMDPESARIGYFAVNADGTGQSSDLDELTYLAWRGGWYFHDVIH